MTSCQRRLGVGGEAGAELLAIVSHAQRSVGRQTETSLSEEVLQDIKKHYQAAKGRVRQLERGRGAGLFRGDQDAVKHLDVAEERVKRGKAELVEANLRFGR